MQKRGDMANQLEFIPLETYEKSLGTFPQKDQEKIQNAIINRISFKPTHGSMLKGTISVNGANLFGLRHFKIGVKGYNKGVYILYRYCKECLINEYYEKSKLQCQFCDESIPDRIVLFLVKPRSSGY